MAYSQEFKDSIVSKLLGGELTVQAASEMHHIPKTTLHAWKRKASLDKVIDDSGLKINKKSKVEKLNLPKNVSYLDAYGAVILKKHLIDVEFGKYCREHGITTNDVDSWEEWFTKHPVAICIDELTSTEECLKDVQSKYKSAIVKIKDGEEALATLGKLLIVSKKAEAIFGNMGN